jgi:two-component system, NarL family, nitrate/nitrite response regulator NarL
MAAEIDRTLTLPMPAAGEMSTVAIANRNEIARAGIEALLQAAGHSVVARCSCEDDLLRSLEAYRPDIIILAENIVRQESRETVLQLRVRNCSVRIIFLLEESDAITTTDLLDLRVEGIVLSAACARSLIECVATVHQGRRWIDPELMRQLATAERADVGALTLREADVAYCVSRGLSNKAIAQELHLSEGTVKMHLHHIYEKLRVGGRTQLALSIAAVSHIQAGPAREPACPDSVAWVRNGRQPKNLA